MRFAEPVIEARLVRRYQRFLADFRLGDGALVTAHCANPGSMLTCLEPGARAWLTASPDPRRKLGYTWQIAEVGRARIFVNPTAANRVVREGIESGVVKELEGYDSVRPEVRCGSRSRIDFLLEREGAACLVEVKSATLRLGPGLAGFPDAPTERGRRHLQELRCVVRRGERAVLLFSVNRSDARALAPADAIDPEYGRELRRAAADGVEVLAYRALVSPREIRLKERVPVELR